eukprot:gene32148-40661_t
MFENLKRTLLRNLIVEIRDLHVRYDGGDSGFETGVRIAAVQLSNAEASGKRLPGK